MADFKENDTLARIAENHLGFIYFWLSEGTDQMNLETEWLVHGIYRVTSSGNLIDGSFKSQYNFPLPFWAPMIEKGMSLPGHPKFSSSVQFSSVAQSCLTLCDPINCSTPGLPVHHQLPEFTQTHVHWVGDAIQPSHPLSSPSPPAPNPSQDQGLFQWVNSSHEVAEVLESQLQHQSFQWTPRTGLL